MRPLDLKNKRFGRLVAIKPTEKRSGSFVVWECVCDCGNTTYAASTNLKQGKTQSCGCLARERASEANKNRAENLVASRFGRLTVTKKLEERAPDGEIQYECVCDCGKKAIVSSCSLRSGNTTSCGCYREELRLIAITSSEAREKHRVLSSDRWPSNAEKIGMRDGTNCTLIKSKKARCDSSTGERGVKYHHGRYMASLQFKGERYAAYGFKTIAEAKKARELMWKEIVEPYLAEQGFLDEDARKEN